MEEPLVSISLVAFNQGPYISEAIESVLMQQVNFSYEIIIHDDASSDNTPEIIRKYASKYPEKIIPILQEENQFSQGYEVNASFTIPRARGKYIAFLEADDYWIDPGKLQTQVDFLEANPDVSMCFTATKHIFSDNARKPKLKRYRKHDAICTTRDVIALGGRLVDMGGAVVRRSIFEDVPAWYHYAQIWDLTVPLLSLLHGNIQYIDQVTSIYRYNVSGSWTQNNKKNFNRRVRNMKKSIRVADGFDQETNFQYHTFIQKKHNPMIVEILLLSNENDQDFDELYARLPVISKLEYKFFKRIGVFKLWEIYRHNKRILTGY